MPSSLTKPCSLYMFLRGLHETRREKKTRRAFLVECDSVSVAEAKVNEDLKDSPYPFEVKVAKESKIVGVI